MSLSSSFINLNKNYQIVYMKGSARGLLGKDLIGFENFRGVLRLMVAENAESFEAEEMDGVMGLGNLFEEMNIFDFGFSSGQLLSSIFAFQLGMHMLGQSSYFYYNISNQDFPDAIYASTMRKKRWALPLQGVFTPDVHLEIYEVGVDTGTSGTILPVGAFMKLEEMYFGGLCEERRESLIDAEVSTTIRKCSCFLQLYPNLTFVSNDITLVLSPQMYIYRTYNSRSCYLGLFYSNIKFAILGANFMQHHIVVFDRVGNRLGFVLKDKKIVMYVKNLMIIDILMVLQCLLAICVMLIGCLKETSSELKVPLIVQTMEMSGNQEVV